MANKLYMKKIFTLFAIGMLFTISTEAKTINKLNTVGINTIVDSIPAQFPGGKEAWVEYLNSKLNYNVPITNNAPVGKYPIAFQFIIDKEGKITDIVFDNDPGYGIKEEVLRVLTNKRMPKWTPASINGELKTYRQKQQLIFSVSID
jgi:protein TonB